MKKLIAKGFSVITTIFLFIAAALPAKAQLFTRTNLETGGLYTALAKDASNNLYVTRVASGTGGSTYEVVKYTGGTGTPAVIFGSLSHELEDFPWGLAVDSHGNIYVATDFNPNVATSNSIIKITISGSSHTASTYQTGRYFSALAIDANDNLYTTEYDGVHGTYAVVEYVANASPGAAGTVLYDNLKAGAGYSYPTGLAVAANGDVYVADAFSNDPSITDGGHVYKLTAANSYGLSTISSGQFATSLALDAAGNLYSAENSGSGYSLVKYANGTNAKATAFSPMHANGIYYPWGIVVIDADHVFAVDGDDGSLGGAVMKLTSNNSALSNFTISSGTLSPAFATVTTSYAVSVGNSVTSVLVRPTATDATATIKVNGTTVASGTVSGNIPLVVGANTIKAVVTAQDGITTKTYTITVTRAASPIATLSNFTISSGTLSPAFATVTTSYAVSVANSVTSVLVRPTATDATATIKVNGTTVASGAVSGAIPLAVGANTIKAVVTAQDGTTTKTYTITVTRAASPIATLSNFTISSGTLSPAFATVTTSYAVSVVNSVTSVLVRPTATDATATIKVNGTTVASGTVSGNIPLVVGANTIKAVVTAQDGITTKTYTIIVTRAASPIATLSNFTISSGTLSPAFATVTTSYAVSVANSVTSVLVRPTATDATATIKVNGTTVASGAVSGAIPLAVGANSINAVVTAQDGATTKTYTITVTRAASPIATLSNFTISSGTLSPAFATATTSYAVSVANSVTSVLVRPTATDATATIKVNGTTVASGAVSGAIPLAVGANSINAVVTAQDGATTKTYTITVTRAVSGLNSLFLPGNREPTTLISTLNEKVVANNILSPNGDGINDIWVVKNIAFYPNNRVTVYDKAGVMVFTKNGYANDWNGTYRGTVLSEGTYYYLVDLGNGSTVKGFITVMRDR